MRNILQTELRMEMSELYALKIKDELKIEIKVLLKCYSLSKNIIDRLEMIKDNYTFVKMAELTKVQILTGYKPEELSIIKSLE